MRCPDCGRRDCATAERRAWLKFIVFVAVTAVMLGGLLYWDGWWAA